MCRRARRRRRQSESHSHKNRGMVRDAIASSRYLYSFAPNAEEQDLRQPLQLLPHGGALITSRPRLLYRQPASQPSQPVSQLSSSGGAAAVASADAVPCDLRTEGMRMRTQHTHKHKTPPRRLPFICAPELRDCSVTRQLTRQRSARFVSCVNRSPAIQSTISDAHRQRLIRFVCLPA